MTLTPTVAIHLTSALIAVVLGPLALWTRLGGSWPRLHRAFGYGFVSMMLLASVSALFIHTHTGPNWAGYSLIHLLIPLTWFSLFGAFRFLYVGNVTGHRKTMIGLYFGACIVAGAFTLLPSRYLGKLLWGG